MKKFLAVMAVATVLLAACSKEKTDPVLDVTMSSFGFYAKDNAGLQKDFVVENPSKDINIVLPYGVDETVLTALVPSFTVDEDAVVTVAEEKVESGVTSLDFSYPVEFLVSRNSKSNAQFTVKVEIAAPQGFAFAAKGEAADSISKGPQMVVSPKDGKPYFATVLNNSDNSLKHPVLFKYEDGSVVKVATVAEVQADQPTLGITSEGVAFFAFYNSSTKFVNVYSVDGSSVAPAGNMEEAKLYKPLTNATYSTIGIAPVSSSDVYLGYGVSANSGSLSKRALNLSHLSGNSWTQENVIAGREQKNYAYEVYSKQVAGVNYMLVFNQNEHSLSLYKFTSEGISTVFEAVKFFKALADGQETAEQAKINLYGLGFDVDAEGTPYVMLLAEASSTVSSGYSPAVYKYADGKMNIVGGVLSSIDGQAAKNLDMALNEAGVPYIVYTDPETKLANYTYIDSKTKVWASPVAVSTGAVSKVDIDFAPDGTGYISCSEKLSEGAKAEYITVYKTL